MRPLAAIVSGIHSAFLVITCLAPCGLYLASRWRRSETFDRGIERSLAALLLLTEFGEILYKLIFEKVPLAAALPMHLCDWALVITALALWRPSTRCFDVAYFWGLAGTAQGLITPALDPARPAWRQIAFFLIHSGIVIGVLFLVLVRRMRPRPPSLLAVLFWSEVYLVVALIANALTGQNYGFLSHPPATPSLLAFFPEKRGAYVATINSVALTAFALLYLPWWIADLRRRSLPA